MRFTDRQSLIKVIEGEAELREQPIDLYYWKQRRRNSLLMACKLCNASIALTQLFEGELEVRSLDRNHVHTNRKAVRYFEKCRKRRERKSIPSQKEETKERASTSSESSEHLPVPLKEEIFSEEEIQNSHGAVAQIPTCTNPADEHGNLQVNTLELRDCSSLNTSSGV